MSKVKANKRVWKGGEMETGREGGGGGGQRTRDRNREKRKKEKYREEHSQGVKLKWIKLKYVFWIAPLGLGSHVPYCKAILSKCMHNHYHDIQMVVCAI